MDGVFPTPESWERVGATVRAYEAGGSMPPGAKRNIFNRDWVPVHFRNTAAETIPAFGVMRITGSEEDADWQRVTVEKPNSTTQSVYLVNGPEPVEASLEGWGTFLFHADWILYDDANTPVYGEEWGPENDSWEITSTGTGFTILGGATGGPTDLVRAVQKTLPASHPVLTGILEDDLDAGSFATVDEIALDAFGTKERTGAQYVVRDLKLNTGESIPEGTIVDFVRDENGWYRWITAMCDVSNNAPADITPDSPVSPGATSQSENAGPYEPYFLQPEPA